MYTQTLKRKPIGPIAGVLYVLLIVFCAFIISFFANYLAFLTKQTYLMYIIYVATLIGLVIIIRSKMTEYTYEIDETSVHVMRMFGKRPKQVEELLFKDIVWAGASKDCDCTKITKQYFGKNVYTICVVYMYKDKKRGFEIAPDAKFAELFFKKYENAQKKSGKNKQNDEA